MAQETPPNGAGNTSLERRNRELATLKAIAETLNRYVHLHQALDETLALVARLMELETAWVFLREPDGRFRLAAYHDLPPAMRYPGPPWQGSCACQGLCEEGQLQTAVNIVECSRLKSAIGDKRGLRYHASVPLRSEDQVIGILNVVSPTWDLFTSEALQLLSAIGYQIGTAIARARLFEEATRLATLDERTRLAREIHDTLAQGLTAITLQLETADMLIEQNPTRARQMIQRALKQARASLEDARRSVMDLRASPLQDQPLDIALGALVEQIAEELGIAVDYSADLQGQRLPTWMEMGLYRIAQEALVNVRKHAQARHVTIRLLLRDHCAILSISDDGRGFDPGQAAEAHAAHRSFGITGMHERARLLGGTLQIQSAPGSGTIVCAEIPVAPGAPSPR
ncbi:MAG: hypothetical protein KatS3mg057_1735 [Herpetosiphonaceae bacterium]|nr:MAG: hypothetical protein KatS3mg057_1735 [Herpetosiphonaceae bacterium]